MIDCEKAGVDIETGYKSVELMEKYVKGTVCFEALGGLGGFSGTLSMSASKGIGEPTLLPGTDDVGIKLKLAFLVDRHDIVGVDCMVMCVGDVARAGDEPLLFLDYTACDKNVPEKTATIVKGMAEGCRQSGSALIGGEVAEMPGFHPEDEYDLVGFFVGIVDKKDLITDENLCAGDVLIGMASSGVHNNGFSLMRKVFEKELTKENLDTYYDELGTTLGKALFAPIRIYVKALKNVEEAGVTVKVCSHIVGDGFYENTPYMLKDDVKAVIRKDSYPAPPVFRLLAGKRQIEERVMCSIYNMRLGMMIAVNPADVKKVMETMRVAGEASHTVGFIEEGEKGVSLH